MYFVQNSLTLWHFFNNKAKVAPLTEYKLRLASMSEGSHVLHFSCDTGFFTALECDDITDADLRVELHIDVRHDTYAMTFNIEGEVSTPCDRCLEPVRIALDEEYRLNVRYGADYDDTKDEILVIPESETTFDVAPIIRDTVLLGLPIRRVHPEGECNPEAERTLHDHAVDIDEEDDYNQPEE